MGIETGEAIIKTIINDMVIIDVVWMFSIILTGLTLLALTRDVNKWKTLAFPIMVGWHIAGVPPFILFYLITAILFAVESLSIEVIGSLLGVIKKPIDIGIEKIKTGTIKQQQHRQFIKQQKTKGAKTKLQTQYGTLKGLGIPTLETQKNFQDINQFMTRTTFNPKGDTFTQKRIINEKLAQKAKSAEVKKAEKQYQKIMAQQQMQRLMQEQQRQKQKEIYAEINRKKIEKQQIKQRNQQLKNMYKQEELKKRKKKKDMQDINEYFTIIRENNYGRLEDIDKKYK